MRRARSDIADGLQAGATQAGGDRSIGAERRHRQRADRLRLRAIGDDLPRGIARQRARRDRGAGNRRTDGKAAPAQRIGYHLQQRALAAEQMRAAGDVEEQPVRRIERDQRREAVAPVGDVVQRLQVSGGIGIVDREFRTYRTRIGERQADRQPGPHRRLVDGM